MGYSSPYDEKNYTIIEQISGGGRDVTLNQNNKYKLQKIEKNFDANFILINLPN